MRDKLLHIGNSLVQHGKINNRIYLMKLAHEDALSIIPKLDELASERGYTKIFAKVPSAVLPFFISNNYVIEASIPNFYENESDCILVSKFLDEKRKEVPEKELKVMNQLLENAERPGKPNTKPNFKLVAERLGKKHIGAITKIFKRVFETYPFPVHDPDYILKTMQEDGTQYFGVLDGEKLIGISTAEVDLENGNAEMTDFAVLPEYRGQSLAARLLSRMEKAMKAANITTCYTIARLNQPGMNKTFLNSGYKYTGTLINNTNIGGSIESMNILYKHI